MSNDEAATSPFAVGASETMAAAEAPGPGVIDAAFGDLMEGRPVVGAQRELIRSMLAVLSELGRDGFEVGDLKIADE